MGSINKTGVINRNKFSTSQRIRKPLKTSIEQSRIKERLMNKAVGVPDGQKIIRRIGVNNIRSNYETIVPHGIGDKAQRKKSHVESVFADYELKQYAEIKLGSSYSEGIYWKSAII